MNEFWIKVFGWAIYVIVSAVAILLVGYVVLVALMFLYKSNPEGLSGLGMFLHYVTGSTL